MSDFEGEIRRVGVVGTGVIGASWAAYFLAHGLEVTATDPGPGAETTLRDGIASAWPALERLGAHAYDPARLRFDPNLAALGDVDFVQENGPEREDFKIELFARLDEILPAHAIVASSSSGLLMTHLQAGCRRPERFLIGHPFNPPHMVPLVEVIGGRQTSSAAIERTLAFYRSIGKRPIHVRKEMPGHVANRLQSALWREAFYLVEQGVASVADIDTAISAGPGLRWAVMGPFALLHLSGGPAGMPHIWEHLAAPMELWWEDLGTPQLTSEFKAKVNAGILEELGGKSVRELEQSRDEKLSAILEVLARTPDES